MFIAEPEPLIAELVADPRFVVRPQIENQQAAAGLEHAEGLAEQIERRKDFETFFDEAPGLHPNVGKITGVVCGVRIEEIEDPLMRNIRYMDKLVDELAKGRPMEKILRQ